MPNYDDTERFHSRKNPRLKHYDYASPNYYFITICTSNKACIFGKAGELNSFGNIAQQGLIHISSHFPGIYVDKYVVMPNHIHAIIVTDGNSAPLPTVIGQYKSYVSKQIHAMEPSVEVWQSSFHDHVIRDQRGYEQIWLYIEANPANWNKDCFCIE